MERAFPGPDVRGAHQTASTITTTAALRAHGARIVVHGSAIGTPRNCWSAKWGRADATKTGGWAEADLVQAADSLSFHTNVQCSSVSIPGGSRRTPSGGSSSTYDRIKVPHARALACRACGQQASGCVEQTLLETSEAGNGNGQPVVSAPQAIPSKRSSNPGSPSSCPHWPLLSWSPSRTRPPQDAAAGFRAEPSGTPRPLRKSPAARQGRQSEGRTRLHRSVDS